MTSPSAKGPHGFVPVTEPVRAHPQRIPGRSHEKPVWPRGRAFDPVPVALLAAAYFGAAQAGLSLAFVAEQVTAVWPPPGIGLAALLLFGSRAWPGITLGAAIVHEKRTGRRARRPAPRDPGAGAPPRLIRGGGRPGPKVPARNGGSAVGTPVPRGERPDGERLPVLSRTGGRRRWRGCAAVRTLHTCGAPRRGVAWPVTKRERG